MAIYSVIYRDEQPKWQPGCPVYVSVVQVARNVEAARCYLQLKLQNLTDARIDKVVLAVHVADLSGINPPLQLVGQRAPNRGPAV